MSLSSPVTQRSFVAKQLMTIWDPLSIFLYLIFDSSAGIGSIRFIATFFGTSAQANKLFDSTTNNLSTPSSLWKQADKIVPSNLTKPLTTYLSYEVAATK